MKPIVEMETVEKVYSRESAPVRALDRVTLSVEKGEFMALCGPSGSGKTTMLNVIGALDEPTSGVVRVEGRDISGMSRSEQARLRLMRLGFIFQAYNLIPVLTACENAEFVLMLQGVPEAERRKRVAAVLERVGLKDMMNRRPAEMSGGQQQRVAIARAVVSAPALVLADEPTANVDSKTAESLLDLMQELNRETGATFIFSTHDPRVMGRARRLVTLLDGSVHGDETRKV
jgi:putative ABC transport system ATP-binding protein